MPANRSRKLLTIAAAALMLLGCRDFSRVDLILAVVFLLNALRDAREGFEAWRRRRVKE